MDDGHSKLLYVAATRALHELCVLHTGNLTGLIAEPVPARCEAKADSAMDTRPTSENKLPHSALRNVSGKQDVPARLRNKKISIVRNELSDETTSSDKPKRPAVKETAAPHTHRKQQAPQNMLAKSSIKFGDMPATEKLRPSGHSKIDLAIRWVTKQADGLYLHSRYGVLRLSPVGSAIVRITFAKGGQITEGFHHTIAVHGTDKRWMYKESGSTVDLMTDELYLQVDKSTGAIRYMNRDKKLLLAERGKECRQLENTPDGKTKTWLYLDWAKGENIYAMGAGDAKGLNLRGTARYISHESHTGELPFLLSDKGYGLLPATDGPVLCCDIPVYGSYIHAENAGQMDFYFITGKRQPTILNAYAYLCGKL